MNERMNQSMYESINVWINQWTKRSMTFFRFDSLAGGMSLFVELNESSLLSKSVLACLLAASYQWMNEWMNQWMNEWSACCQSLLLSMVRWIDRCPHFIILFHWNRSLQTTLGRLTWMLGHYGILGEKNKSLWEAKTASLPVQSWSRKTLLETPLRCIKYDAWFCHRARRPHRRKMTVQR